jgi:hypothetical protein
VLDLLEPIEAGKEHGLASAQAGKYVLGITLVDDQCEVLDVGAGVGRRPLVGVDAVASDKVTYSRCPLPSLSLTNVGTAVKANVPSIAAV